VVVAIVAVLIGPLLPAGKQLVRPSRGLPAETTEQQRELDVQQRKVNLEEREHRRKLGLR
jgi:hypothetical protein